jgi:hypothetical protein
MNIKTVLFENIKTKRPRAVAIPEAIPQRDKGKARERAAKPTARNLSKPITKEDEASMQKMCDELNSNPNWLFDAFLRGTRTSVIKKPGATA